MTIRSNWPPVGVMIGVVAGTILGVEAWAASRLSGIAAPPGRLPGLVPALTFVVSMAPFLVWRSTRAEWRSADDASPAFWSVMSIFIVLGLIAATTTVSALAARLSGLPVFVQYAGCVSWLVGCFLWHRHLIIRHFRQADLI